MGYITIPTILTGYSKINSGNYTGNDTVNRAIPHGLGNVPIVVFIQRIGEARMGINIIGNEIAYLDPVGGDGRHYTVTATDSTNFYVGNATHYEYSANGTASVYHWVVFIQK